MLSLKEFQTKMVKPHQSTLFKSKPPSKLIMTKAVIKFPDQGFTFHFLQESFQDTVTMK